VLEYNLKIFHPKKNHGNRDTSPITLCRKKKKHNNQREITLNSEIIQLEALWISKKLSRGLNSRDVEWIRHGLLYAIQIMHT